MWMLLRQLKNKCASSTCNYYIDKRRIAINGEVFKKTIRNNECSFLLPRQSRTQWSNCKDIYLKCLRFRTQQGDSNESKIQSSSKAPLSNLTFDELLERARNLKKFIRNSQRQVKHLLNLYQKEKQKHVAASTNFTPPFLRSCTAS